MQWSYMMALAVSAANSDGPLDDVWFDSIEDSQQEADDLRFRTNAERASASVIAKRLR